MPTAAPLRIPVVIDGRTAVASFEQIQDAAAKARDTIQDQIAGSARVQATGSQAAAEMERRRISLVLQGIEDTTERRVASINLTSALEAQAIEKLIQARLRAGEITKAQASELRTEFDRVSEAARQTQIGQVQGGLGGVARQGRNASEALVQLGRGFEDASFAQGNFAQIVRFSANNVSQFVTQLGYAKTEAKATGTTVTKSLVGALAGPGGLVLALGAAMLAYELFGERAAQALGLVRDETEATRKQVAEWAAELYDIDLGLDLRLGIYSVEELSSTLDLAREDLERVKEEEDALIRSLAEGSGALGTNVDRLGLFVFGSREAKKAVRDMGDEVAAQEAVVRALSDALAEYNAQADRLSSVSSYDLGMFDGPLESFFPQESPDDRKARLKEEERERERAQRKAETAARQAERRRQSEARREAREAAREAKRTAEERAKLRADLLVLSYQEGFDREKQELLRQRNERLKIAGQDASLRLAVERQYQRELSALRRETARAVVDRERANLDAVAEARAQAYDQLGRTDAEAAQADIDRVRGRAAEATRLYVERYDAQADALRAFYADAKDAAALEQALTALQSERSRVEADLAEVVRTGTFAEAERLAVLAATDESLRPVLDLLLARLDAEARLAATVRSRRIEGAEEAREEADRERERADRLARAQSALQSGGRQTKAAAGSEGIEEAAARLRRARQALADVDAALATLYGTAAEIVEAEDGSVQVIVQGQRVIGDEAERIAEERKARAGEVADAEVEAAEAAADAVRESYADRLDAAESYAARVIDALEAELTRASRFSDVQREITLARFAAEEKDLRESLRRKQIDIEEHERRLTELRASRTEFEEEAQSDERNLIRAFAQEGTAILVDEFKKRAAAYIAEQLTIRLFGRAAQAEATAAAVASGQAITAANAPAAATTSVATFGTSAAVGAAALLAALAVMYGAVKAFRVGGRVDGPGGPTEDRVPALLSAGEHVLTAREVLALGGHEAVYRLRERALLGSLPRFATGGAVLPPQPRPTVSVVSADTLVAHLDLAPLTARLDALLALEQETARRQDRQLGEIERIKTTPPRPNIFPSDSVAIAEVAARSRSDRRVGGQFRIKR